MVVGGLGAIALGAFLIPLRHTVSPSNLAFLFLIWTIVVAEMGGRGSALLTALLSAISLNFFLIEPYLNLTIDKTEDFIAFFALAVSGLVAAAFGRRREEWSDVAKRATDRLDWLALLVQQLRKDKPVEEVLEDLQHQFGLGAIALRDGPGKLLAAAPSGYAPATAPKTELNPSSLFPTEGLLHRYGAKGFRFPEGGGRLIYKHGASVLSFDLSEGDARGLDTEMSQTLAIALFILALEFSGRERLTKETP